MGLLKNIEIIDLALYLNQDKTLIISDTHIGYEEALNKQGILIPRFQFKETVERLKNIINNKQFKNKAGNKLFQRIIINGDIKHEFGIISEQEWRHTLMLLDFLSHYCERITLIKGNHDTILGPIAKKRNIEIVDYVIIKDTLIVHGDKLDGAILGIIKNKKNIKTIIIGHEHPAVSLVSGARKETFKCYLKGKFKSKTLIVQPSFNLVAEGTDILKEKLLSPFLQQDLSSFSAYIVGDKVYEFGVLSRLR